MLSHALHARFADNAEQRASDRRHLRLEARAATPGQAESEDSGVEVHNLSPTGMLVECSVDLPVGAALDIELPGGSIHRAEVVWADEGLLGCRFARRLSAAQLSAALLRADPIAPTTAPPRLTQDEAIDRLRQHWDFETPVQAAPEREKPLGLGMRLWIIGGLAAGTWALPVALWAIA